MRLIFTSCMDAERVPDQPIWDEIRGRNPHVLMLLGDQIYMDWGVFRRNWRQAIDKDQEAGLQAFAEVMHRRYARQWAVDSFRALITSLSNRDASHLLLTWDDHDFAWNNSWGGKPAQQGKGDGSKHDKHHVPDAVKRIAHALFRQFERTLRGAEFNHPYPDLPSLGSMKAQVGLELTSAGSLGVDGPPFFLLDTRWHRQGRVEGGREVALLSDHTRDALMGAAVQPKGLLVVAGGTPMWHKGKLAHEAWCSEQEAGRSGNLPAYREYAELVRGAQRPVLYLSGDIHRNAFTGRLRVPPRTGGPSQVLQILASGAALGRLGPKTFAPSFVELELPQAPALTGAVEGALCHFDGREWQVRRLVSMDFGRNGWTDDWDGGAAGEDRPLPLDLEPMDLLVARPLDPSPWARTSQCDTLFSECDDCFKRVTVGIGDSAMPAMVEAVNFDADHEPKVRLTHWQPIDTQARMKDVFQRAENLRRPVVFFIHGFGKSLPDALAQAYQLRDLYACEPLLYAWNAGLGGGLFETLNGISTALRSAEEGAGALHNALKAFDEVSGQFNNVTSVVVARSTGALALDKALQAFGVIPDGKLRDVTRVVLSAPLVSERDWKSEQSLANLAPQVVITRNRNDETLRLARWQDGKVSIMGWDGDFKANRADGSDVCLDFTKATGVFDAHDYLLNKLSPQQFEVNKALLTAIHFNPTKLSQYLTDSGNAIWNVN
jgi:hypothetical protein